MTKKFRLLYLYFIPVFLLFLHHPSMAQKEPNTYAIVNVTVVPMDSERVISGQTVLISDKKIRAIGNTDDITIPENAVQIDGTDKYLMPGLSDMHVHIFSEEELLFYFANGITTVRNMWGWDLHLELRERITKGEITGPRIYTSGAIIDGDPPTLRGSAVVRSFPEAMETVEKQIEAGYDFIKVYDNLDGPAYNSVVLAARREGVPVVGHVPGSVGLTGAILAGQKSVEHFDGFAEFCSDSSLKWSSDFDPGKVKQAAKLLVENGIWVTPTLVVKERQDMSASASEQFLKKEEIAYLPQFYKRFCCGEPYDPADDLEEEVIDTRRSNRFLLVKTLYKQGVRFLLGTDTGNRFVLPGYDIHSELALLVEAGLTPYQALRTGTKDAAEFLGNSDQAGTIEEGKVADLILTSENPLSNISTLRNPEGVMVHGLWLSKENIEEIINGRE